MRKGHPGIRIGALLTGGALLGLLLAAGCVGPGESGQAPVTREALTRYLSECELDTPTIIAAARGRLARGEVFRDRVRDAEGRATLATIWIDPETPDLLRVRTMRTIPCPDCGGTGARQSFLTGRTLQTNANVQFRCLRCDGTGVLEDHVEERRFLLAGGDQLAPAVPRHARRPAAQLPPGAQAHIQSLASKDPHTRLRALEWLDAHVVKEDMFFGTLRPMLRKAVWIEQSEDAGVILYQFRAGSGEHPSKAAYRVFVDSKSGEVSSKGFVGAQGARRPGRPGESGPGLVEETTSSVLDWFTEGWDTD